MAEKINIVLPPGVLHRAATFVMLEVSADLFLRRNR